MTLQFKRWLQIAQEFLYSNYKNFVGPPTYECKTKLIVWSASAVVYPFGILSTLYGRVGYFCFTLGIRSMFRNAMCGKEGTLMLTVNVLNVEKYQTLKHF
jgi:hypothetical protein